MAHAAVRPHHAANHFFILSLIYPCFSFNILSFVLFPYLYIVGFAAHAAPPHGFLFRWANPCRFYAPARLVPRPAERPVSLPAEGPRPKGAHPFLFLKKGGRKARRPHGLPPISLYSFIFCKTLL